MPAPLIPVRAFAVSSTLQPKQALSLFPPAAERVRVTKTIAVIRYGEASWVTLHDFGVLVLVGMDEDESNRLEAAFRSLVGETSRPPLKESFAIELEPGATPKVAFDRVILPELDARAAALISLVVAQSVAMEYYEGDLDALISALAERSRLLAKEGRLRGSKREMMRFIGKGMTMRSEVLQTVSLLDSPGITWENEALDRLYRELRGAFEIGERYEALEHEIRTVQDDLALLVDIARQRQFIVLEVVVAIFVVVETLLFVGQLLLRAAP